MPNDFDLIAPVYDALARMVFGSAQQKAQAHFLSYIPAQARVLVLGGGTGRVLLSLFQKSFPATVLYLESSANMLAKAQTRFTTSGEAEKVEFRLGTEAEIKPEETFHVVITPFVLDLFTEPELATLLQKVDAALLPQGLWLHTDFHLATSGRKRLWQKPMLWAMYHFFKTISHISGQRLPAFDQLFWQQGFTTLHQAFFYRGFIRAQVLQKTSR